MKSLTARFWTDEYGMVLSAELMVLVTVGVFGIVTGVASFASSVNMEYADLANAMSSLDQSYNVQGHEIDDGEGSKPHGRCSAMGYNDSGASFTAQTVQATVAGQSISVGGAGVSVGGQGAVGFAAAPAEAMVAIVEDVEVDAETAAALQAQGESILIEEVEIAERRAASGAVASGQSLEEANAELIAQNQALRLQQAEVQALVRRLAAEDCPLSEIQDIRARLKKLQSSLERLQMFDCKKR